MTYYAVTDGSSKFIVETKEDAEREAREYMANDAEANPEMPRLELHTEPVEMTRAEFDALREFDGF